MTCNVCKDPNILEINRLLIRNEAYRRIAEMFGLTKSAIGRHASKCYADEMETAREAKAIDRVLRTEETAISWAASIQKLIAMASDWLADPRNPEKFTMEPRAEAVNIIYIDPTDLDTGGNPKKKSAPMQALLDKCLIGKESISVRVPKVDYVGVMMEAMKTGARFLDILAKLRGEYSQKRRNPADLELDIDYLMRTLGIDRDEAVKKYKEWFGDGDFSLAPGTH